MKRKTTALFCAVIFACFAPFLTYAEEIDIEVDEEVVGQLIYEQRDSTNPAGNSGLTWYALKVENTSGYNVKVNVIPKGHGRKKECHTIDAYDEGSFSFALDGPPSGWVIEIIKVYK